MKRFVATRVRAGAAAVVAISLHTASRAIHTSPLQCQVRDGVGRQLGNPMVYLSSAAPLVVARRCQASGGQSRDDAAGEQHHNGTSNTAEASTKKKEDSHGPTAEEQAVIDRAKPDSAVYEERLGFTAGESFGEEALKEHFFILAKYYHPDSPSAPPNSAGSFTNIKEAYDALQASLKSGRSYTGGSATGPQYADQAARQARMRALGDGVMFFVLVTFIYIIVIAIHNRDRLHSRYLWHLVGIFFLIQLFPRLLAAAVLFAAHTTYLVANNELTEQAAVTLLVQKGPKDLSVQLQGIDDRITENVVVQVETSTTADDGGAAAAARSGVATSTMSTTLTLDAGVTRFTIPLPPKGKENCTTYKVKAVDEKRAFVLADKEFKLM